MRDRRGMRQDSSTFTTGHGASIAATTPSITARFYTLLTQKVIFRSCLQTRCPQTSWLRSSGLSSGKGRRQSANADATPRIPLRSTLHGNATWPTSRGSPIGAALRLPDTDWCGGMERPRVDSDFRRDCQVSGDRTLCRRGRLRISRCGEAHLHELVCRLPRQATARSAALATEGSVRRKTRPRARPNGSYVESFRRRPFLHDAGRAVSLGTADGTVIHASLPQCADNSTDHRDARVHQSNLAHRTADLPGHAQSGQSRNAGSRHGQRVDSAADMHVIGTALARNLALSTSFQCVPGSWPGKSGREGMWTRAAHPAERRRRGI